MRISRLVWSALFIFALVLTACEEASPATDPNTPAPNPIPTTAGVVVNTPAGAVPTEVTLNVPPPGTPPPTQTLPAASTPYCKNGGAINPAPNEALAAKVNGQGIPLGLYQRQAAQAQAALAAQGLDPNSKQGQEEIKGLQQQVLGQLIDDLVIEQAARQENVNVTNQDVDNRIQQLINDAGGRDKFDDYLKTNQLLLDDLCTQIRTTIFGETMLNRVTAALPTKVEQVHAAHILLSTKAEADQVLAQVKAKKDFAALAKQYSKEEATRNNGGDLGWFPKGIMPPEFEAAAFQLQPGQVSGVVTTPLGFHIIKVLERDPARVLSPELAQNQKQQAFLAWLDARRKQAKIEHLVNP